MDALGIQWKILLAQTISFSIVFIVLWRFAYKPVFNLLEARKTRIAASLAEAEKIKAELARTEADREKILADAGDLANKIIAEARAAVAHVTEQETQKAVAESERIIAKAREATAQERNAMFAELKREVGRLVVQTTTTITGKVLTAEDQRRLAEETQKQLA